MTPTTAAAVESASTVVQLYDITKTSFNNNNNGESSEAVLIMPAVCIGNVGQLAIDILLETYKDSIQHVAALHHPLVVPCFGMNPYGDVKNAHASHPIDMYRLNSQEQENSSTVYYLMQQRAPASAGCQVQFANDIMTWISSTETVKFSAVWVLGSLDATLRQDEDLQGNAVRSIYSLEHGDIDDTMIYSTMVKQCEECGVTALGDWRNIKKEYVQYEGHMPWPLIQAAEEHGVSAVGLVSFVIEGDNRGDAFEMSKTALRVMKLPVKGESTEDVSDEHSGTGRRERELVEPKSWRLYQRSGVAFRRRPTITGGIHSDSSIIVSVIPRRRGSTCLTRPRSILNDGSSYSLVQSMDSLVAGTLGTQGSTSLDGLVRLVPLVFGAGILTSISPCTLSVLPLTIGYIGGYSSPRDGSLAGRSIAFAAGLATTLSMLGVLSVLLGKAYGQVGGPWLALTASGIAIVMGLSLLEVIVVPLPSLQIDAGQGWEAPVGLKAYVAGLTCALVASPCSTPILATLLAYVSTTDDYVQGGLLLFSYALGYVAPLMGAAFFTDSMARIVAVREVTGWVSPVSGALLIAGGTYGILSRIF